MRRSRWVRGSLGAALVALVAIGAATVGSISSVNTHTAAAQAKPSEPEPTNLGCVTYQATARYVPYGYSHVVTLKNGCTQKAYCEVSSDVDPEPVHQVEVDVGAEVSVTTRLVSPSRTFTARVGCAFKPPAKAPKKAF
ncbi:MAG: hypothetical protein KC543_09410 [Myxococcales bacterium]|nr:hypothetical protein [Myxococcales bacterium]